METFPEGTVLIDTHHSDEVHSIFELLHPEWRRMTLLLWGVWLGLAFLYWGTIQVVTLVFVEDDTGKNGELEFDYSAIFSSCCAEIVGQTVVLFFIHRTGRTKITALTYLLGGISVFGLCFAAANENTERQVLIVLAFVARGFAMGASSMTWLVTAELLPTPVRSTGHSAANGISRIGGAVSPFLVSPSVPMETIGIVMGCVSIAASIVAWNLPETSGQSLGTAGRVLVGSDGKRIEVSEVI